MRVAILEEEVAEADRVPRLGTVEDAHLPAAEHAVGDPAPVAAPVPALAPRQLEEPRGHEHVRAVLSGDHLVQLGVGRIQVAGRFHLARVGVGRLEAEAVAEPPLDFGSGTASYHRLPVDSCDVMLVNCG